MAAFKDIGSIQNIGGKGKMIPVHPCKHRRGGCSPFNVGEIRYIQEIFLKEQ